MPICIPWSTELLPDLAVCVAQGSAKVSSQPSQAQGMFGRADQALLLDARMAIPGGAAAELGAGELIQLVWAQPYCIHAGRASSAPVLHALAFEAGMLDLTLQFPQDSVKSWVFSYLDIFLMSPKTLWTLTYCIFWWSYNFHFASEKLSTRLLKVPSVVFCICWDTEALGHRIKSRRFHPQPGAFLLTAVNPLHSHCWLSTVTDLWKTKKVTWVTKCSPATWSENSV